MINYNLTIHNRMKYKRAHISNKYFRVSIYIYIETRSIKKQFYNKSNLKQNVTLSIIFFRIEKFRAILLRL